MRQEHTTIINDCDGTKHTYELLQHPATKGLILFQRILSSVAHPLGALVSAFQKSGSLPDSFEGEAMVKLLLDDGLDAQVLGVAADLMIQKVGDNMDLFHELLRYTTRDGMALSDQSVFDEAYQGNYGELMQAISWSVKINFSSMMGAASFPFGRKAGAVSALTGKQS